MVSTIIHSTEKEIVDRYFAAQAAGPIPPELTKKTLANFGINGGAPSPMRDMRGKAWRLNVAACEATLQVIMNGGSYSALLAGTTVYRGDRYQVLVVVAEPHIDLVLLLLENDLEQRDDQT
jgi:hypothetical protein